MSKIGRKPIQITSAQIDIHGNTVTISGAKAKFVHTIPEELSVTVKDKCMYVSAHIANRKSRMVWGLHRALLANKIKGAENLFEQKMIIVGLGYKAQIAGKKLTFTLGYTHKIDYVLPDDVTVDIDKTGQNLLVKSADKFSLGNVCDAIRSFREPEPYKGTGIMKEGEIIRRKEGKTKAG